MATKTGIALMFSRLAACCRVPAEIERRPEAAIDTWALVLADIEDDDLAVAVMAYLRENTGAQWWPSPAALIALTPAGKRRAVLIEAANDMWGYVVEAGSRHGSRYLPPTPTTHEAWAEAITTRPGLGARLGNRRWRLHDDRIVCEALEAGIRAAGGWDVLAGDITAHGPARAAFRAAYEGRLSRAPTSPAVAQLEARNGPIVRRIKAEDEP